MIGRMSTVWAMIIAVGVKSSRMNPNGPTRDMSRKMRRPTMTVGRE